MHQTERVSSLGVAASTIAPRQVLLNAIQERFRPFQTAPTAMLLVDPQGVILLTNTRLDAIFGYGPGELAGMPVEALVPPDVRERHASLRQAFLEYPVARQMGASRDLFGWSRTGRPIPVEIGFTTLDVEGERVVLAFVLDLTHRKKQEEKFRLVVDAAPNGLLLVDVAGCIAFANRQVCAMFGYSQQDLLGQPVEKLMPERLRLKHQVYRTSFTQKPDSRPMGVGRELFGQRKDGSEFPIEIGLTPLDVDDGRFIVSTVLDITERERVAEEIRQKNSQLSRLNEELTSFAHSVSHDLKAPLSAIQGLARLAVEDLEAADYGEAKSALEKIRSQSDKLKNLIEDVLAMAQSDAGDERWSPVNISNTVLDAVEGLRQLAADEGVELRLALESGLILCTHEPRLVLIAKNLVSNAIRYCDPHKTLRFVEVDLSDASSCVELRVRDNGLGIPAEYHAHVFGMFRKFHTHRAEGSGLGLALVRKETARLGGRVEFESSPEGTTFVVTLPKKEEQDAERCSGN